MNVILFLIQWFGGIYCMKKHGYVEITWQIVLLCAFMGWIMILICIYDECCNHGHTSAHSSTNTSANTNENRSSSIKPTETAPSGQEPRAQNQTAKDTRETILDEKRLFDLIKNMPVKWDYYNPDAAVNTELKKFCSSCVNYKPALAYISKDYFRQAEYLVQKKRARTPQKAAYNKVMEKNIMFELYEYAYMMNVFKVLENRKNDTLKIDGVELWNLIQEDCHKRLDNPEAEKRKNPAIYDMMQKYTYDTSKIKMIVNDYVEPREYDYIYACAITGVLIGIMELVLVGEANEGNGWQRVLQIFRQFSASDFIAELDVTIKSMATFALGMYANNGRIPRKSEIRRYTNEHHSLN